MPAGQRCNWAEALSILARDSCHRCRADPPATRSALSRPRAGRSGQIQAHAVAAVVARQAIAVGAIP